MKGGAYSHAGGPQSSRQRTPHQHAAVVVRHLKCGLHTRHRQQPYMTRHAKTLTQSHTHIYTPATGSWYQSPYRPTLPAPGSYLCWGHLCSALGPLLCRMAVRGVAISGVAIGGRVRFIVQSIRAILLQIRTGAGCSAVTDLLSPFVVDMLLGAHRG